MAVACCPKTGPADGEAGYCCVNPLRSGAAIEAKHPTESFATLDITQALSNTILRLDQRVVQPLMSSLGMVMLCKLMDGTAKRVLAEEDHPVDALISCRSLARDTRSVLQPGEQ